MSLVDISNLGSELKDSFLQNTDWPEVAFNSFDKQAISELPNVEKVESHSIKFKSENNIIFIPSQYILFAIKIKPFATELIKYTNAFDNLKSLNDNSPYAEIHYNSIVLTFEKLITFNKYLDG